MLRNRHHAKSHLHNERIRIINHSIFTEPTLETELPKLLDDLPDELAAYANRNIIEKIGSRKIPEREKIELAKIEIEEISKHRQTIYELSENEALMHSIAKRVELQEEDASFLETLAEHLFPGMVTSMIPGGMIAGSLLPTIASATGFQIVSGVPKGMTGFCQSLQSFCVDGYVLDDNNNTLTQFMRVFNPAGSGSSAPASALMQDCLSVNTVGNMTATYILNNNATGANICTSNSGLFSGVTVAIQATKMNLATCTNFNALLQPLYQQCMNQASSTASLMVIIAGSVGGAIALAAAAFCIWKMKKMGDAPKHDVRMSGF